MLNRLLEHNIIFRYHFSRLTVATSFGQVCRQSSLMHPRWQCPLRNLFGVPTPRPRGRKAHFLKKAIEHLPSLGGCFVPSRNEGCRYDFSSIHRLVVGEGAPWRLGPQKPVHSPMKGKRLSSAEQTESLRYYKIHVHQRSKQLHCPTRGRVCRKTRRAHAHQHRFALAQFLRP